MSTISDSSLKFDRLRGNFSLAFRLESMSASTSVPRFMQQKGQLALFVFLLLSPSLIGQHAENKAIVMGMQHSSCMHGTAW